MRYKEQTLRKLEAQSTKLATLERAISNTDISGADAIKFIQDIRKDIDLVVERLGLEADE
jgi:hypothetical protein